VRLTWKVTSGQAWSDYQRALLARQPPGYPPCLRGDLTVVCKRTLIGDVFVIEVEAADQGTHELVARFPATAH
jgi:hypothetical protein